MGRSYSHLKSATQILNEYKSEEPFASFLKKYFARHKKFGSKDRKQISHFCYCYFRLGKALLDAPTEERIMIGLFLCSNAPSEILEQLKPEWNKKNGLPIEEKLFIIDYSRLSGLAPLKLQRGRSGQALLIANIFPFKEQLSNDIDHEKFCESFFIQPDLFIRLRPGYESIVKTKLLDHGLIFSEITSSCLSLPNASRIENIIALDKEAVVQDYTSQQNGVFLKNFKFHDVGPAAQVSGHRLTVWDCCAASGGKSLMLYDMYPDIELTVSDIRESILVNLKKRFAAAGLKNYKSFVADLTRPLSDKPQIPGFEFIICDAPCTGSGTWSRTPEQLYFFNEKKIEQYSVLQKKIVSNIVSHLERNAFLLYITCSVFRRENEEVVEFIQDSSKLELISMQLLKGYDKKADTMFVALFKRTL